MVEEDFIARKNVFDYRGIDLDDDDFADDQDSHCDGTRIEDFPDIVKSRVPNHAIVGAVGEEHQDINYHNDKDPVPAMEHDAFIKMVVVHKEHGYQVGDKQHHDIKSQNPNTG